MKISVLSLFRDSEPYLADCLKRLDNLEANTDAEFSYFFYENDSKDNTRQLLKDWCSGRGQLTYEDIRTPKFGSVNVSDRFVLMSYYRNILLKSCIPLQSDYTLILDSDVKIDADLITQYLQFADNNVAMLTSNTLAKPVKCVMCDCAKDCYYDSLALQDCLGNATMTWSCNPFYRKEDRALWDSGQPVKVNRAFAGAALVKTSVLNQVSWNLRDPTNPECEHWGFCDKVRQFGDILVIPSISPYVEIAQNVLDGISQDQFNNVAGYQKKVLDVYFNIKLS
jgi:hypothetical protein